MNQNFTIASVVNRLYSYLIKNRYLTSFLTDPIRLEKKSANLRRLRTALKRKAQINVIYVSENATGGCASLKPPLCENQSLFCSRVLFFLLPRFRFLKRSLLSPVFPSLAILASVFVFLKRLCLSHFRFAEGSSSFFISFVFLPSSLVSHIFVLQS